MQNYTFFYKLQLFLRIFFHFSMSRRKKIASPVDFPPQRLGAICEAGAPKPSP